VQRAARVTGEGKEKKTPQQDWLQPAEHKQLLLAVLCCESTFLTGSQARLQGRTGLGWEPTLPLLTAALFSHRAVTSALWLLKNV